MIDNFTDTELTNEVWRDVDGYDGMYQVSDLGRVRSRKSGEWKVLRANKRMDGYVQVRLSKDGKQNTALVHRLVASAFIPNDDSSKTIINHRNEVKSENSVSNLEWCDYQYNSTYKDIHLRHKQYIHPKYKRDKIKELYRPDLSVDDNLEIFKANGIECCRATVQNLRRDINLKGRSNWKRGKIKDLYRPDLTSQQNIDMLKEQGIECGKRTITQLRKDLGLPKQWEPKLCKIKDLYNPDLSARQNLEIFRANGIECCSNTIWRLRKELGLVKEKTKLDEIKPIYNPSLSYDENIKVFKENGVYCSIKAILKLRKELGLTKCCKQRKKQN